MYQTCKFGDDQISLEEYIDRLKEGQNELYYTTLESLAAASSAPFLEHRRKKGHETAYILAPRR